MFPTTHIRVNSEISLTGRTLTPPQSPKRIPTPRGNNYLVNAEPSSPVMILRRNRMKQIKIVRESVELKKKWWRRCFCCKQIPSN